MDFSDWWLRYFLWSCPNMNVTELRWWSVNIGSVNGLVPSGNITWANVKSDLCRHMVSLRHNELMIWAELPDIFVPVLNVCQSMSENIYSHHVISI